MPQTTKRTTSGELEQTADDLEAVIEATEAVDWSNVSEIPVGDVAKWTQKLEYARKVVERDAEK